MAKGKTAFKKFLHTWKGHCVLIFGVFLLLLVFLPGNNIFVWIAARREIRAQERQIKRYHMEIAEMHDRVENLSQNADSLETYAREHFHFSKEGEDVYLVK